MHYITTNVRASRRKTIMAYLTAKQKLEVLKEAGDTGFILYDFYVSKGCIPEYEYSDEKSGAALGWLPSKVKRVRLSLEKLGYIYTERTPNVLVVTVIGKDNVIKALLNKKNK